MALPNWSPSANWDSQTLNLLNDFKLNPLPVVSFQDILNSSHDFPIHFPTKNNKCTFLKAKTQEDSLTRNIRSVYPVLHESALKLCADFIMFKRQFGSKTERVYYENFSIKDLVDKMLRKRAVHFLDASDDYGLLNGKSGSGGWENVGTPCQKDPLLIEDVMTYDELKISAFLSVTSYTYFVNEGHRTNIGKYQENRSLVEDSGVIIGMIGTRLEKPRVMEYQDIVISKTQNTRDSGFGSDIHHSVPKLFANFYDEQSLTFDEAWKAKNEDFSHKYTIVLNDLLFDNHFYYKRLAISVDTLLLEANSRAREASKNAYIHVVGLGLGVWKISEHQNKLYMDTFAERLKVLSGKLHSVSDICFAYIRQAKCGGYSDGDVFPIKGHPKGGIKIHILNRNPHAKLTGDDEGKLLVVSYAWDGNALPGNEYWLGSLAGSGDPAAACSTQICEIHNPHINPLVSADNLRIVTDDGVLSVTEYQMRIADKQLF